MAEVRSPMPARALVDRLFDGHPERRLLELGIHERLDWIWEAMVLLRLGRSHRARLLCEEDTSPVSRQQDRLGALEKTLS